MWAIQRLHHSNSTRGACPGVSGEVSGGGTDRTCCLGEADPDQRPREWKATSKLSEAASVSCLGHHSGSKKRLQGGWGAGTSRGVRHWGRSLYPKTKMAQRHGGHICIWFLGAIRAQSPCPSICQCISDGCIHERTASSPATVDFPAETTSVPGAVQGGDSLEKTFKIPVLAS